MSVAVVTVISRKATTTKFMQNIHCADKHLCLFCMFCNTAAYNVLQENKRTDNRTMFPSLKNNAAVGYKTYKGPAKIAGAFQVYCHGFSCWFLRYLHYLQYTHRQKQRGKKNHSNMNCYYKRTRLRARRTRMGRTTHSGFQIYNEKGIVV